MNLDKLKIGDVIFIPANNEKNISSLSEGYGGFSYYHCGICTGDNKLIEAVSYYGVIEDDISKYHDKKILVARVELTEIDIKKVICTAKSYLGYRYNELFLPNQTNKLYCSELVHLAFFTIDNKDFFTPHTLNYFSVEDGEISDFWIELYAKHDFKVPQSENGSHPNNLSLDRSFTEFFFYS